METNEIVVYKSKGESLGIAFNRKSDQQNVVYAIQEGSVLHRSHQIVQGDIIQSIAGEDVQRYSAEQLIEKIGSLKDDTEVKIVYRRNSADKSSGSTPATPTISVEEEANPGTISTPQSRSRRKPALIVPPKLAVEEVVEQAVKPRKLGIREEKEKKNTLSPKSNNNLIHSKSLDLGVVPNWRGRGHITLQNYCTGEQTADRLHTQAAHHKETGCHPTHCVGSQIWPKEHPRSKPYSAPRAPEVMKQKAEEYLKIYFESQKIALGENYGDKLRIRLDEVYREIDSRGHYDLTYSELAYGARLAWRNAPRCVNRIVWRQLEVLDARDITTAKDMFDAICHHLRFATNGGNLRSTITIFNHRTKLNSDFRVWNSQLIRYAGYKQSDGTIIGDPDGVEFTEVCQRLGWTTPTPLGRFDVLPLVLQANGGNPEVFEIPKELVMEVDIVHPDFKWFKDLKLKWYAVPAVANMLLDVGGLEFTACPFNGWYMSSEIASRNFGDEYRYNMHKIVAEKMKLNTSTYKLWKDRAMVEINSAVLHSYQQAGVSIVDHHSATEGFMAFYKNEISLRGGCPGDWVWLVPPISGSATPVFHQELLLYYLTPSYEYQDPPWKHYQLPGEVARTAHPKFRGVALMVLDATRMMRNVKQKRIKATVLYATETGRSKNYANIVKNLFDRTFNCTVYSMDEYSKGKLEHEQLVLLVTSTFGSGDPPANGETFGRYLMDLRAGHIRQQTPGYAPPPRSKHGRVSAVVPPSLEMLNKAREEMSQPLGQVKFAVFGLGSRAYPNFCAFAHTLDNLMLTLGAEQICHCGEGDELCGQEESFQSWLRECYLRSCELYKTQHRLGENEFTPGKTTYKKDLYRIVPFTGTYVKKELCQELSHVHHKKILSVTLKSRAKLQAPSSDRSTISVKMECSQRMIYQPGDHIAIYPQNHSTLVNQLLERLTLPCGPDDPIMIESQSVSEDGDVSWTVERRLPAIVTIRDAFTYFLDITTPPSPQLLQNFQKLASHKLDRDKLEKLGTGADDYEDWKFERYPNILDVINQFHSLKLDVAMLLQQLPLLQCRYYSISSSLNAHPREIHATVAVVTFNKRGGGKGFRHNGVCSTWLNRMEIGTEIPCIIRTANSFHMPTDTRAPIIMVGPGTGIAPFRSFWQERMFARSEGLKKQILSHGTPLAPPAAVRRISGHQIPDMPANRLSVSGGRRSTVSTITQPVQGLLNYQEKEQEEVPDLSSGEEDDDESEEEDTRQTSTDRKKSPSPRHTLQPAKIPLRRSASDESQSKNLAELLSQRDTLWGSMSLYFGCRRSDTDYIYRDEIQRAHLTGALTDINVAFSRQPGQPKTYVQHLLRKNADKLVQQLIAERGHFYVCGDISMAADVGRTLQNIFEENAAMSPDEARQLIESMKDNGFYHEDIFGVTLKTAEVTNRVRTAAKKAWRILVTAADNNPSLTTPLSARPPTTPITPLPDTPMTAGGRLTSSRAKRPTVIVLMPQGGPSQNEPTTPGGYSNGNILGKRSEPFMDSKSKGRKARHQRAQDDEDIDRGDAMLRITDYSGSHDSSHSGRSILAPHSPRSPKPVPAIPAITEEDEEEKEEKEEKEDTTVVLRNKKTKKIRSNSIIQTDV